MICMMLGYVITGSLANQMIHGPKGAVKDRSEELAIAFALTAQAAKIYGGEPSHPDQTAGLLVGYPDGMFRGKRPQTRYEMAVFAHTYQGQQPSRSEVQRAYGRLNSYLIPRRPLTESASNLIDPEFKLTSHNAALFGTPALERVREQERLHPVQFLPPTNINRGVDRAGLNTLEFNIRANYGSARRGAVKVEDFWIVDEFGWVLKRRREL